MRDRNYITIQWFMINQLKLSWNELILYALIYWFSQDWNTQFRGSLSYIEDWLWVWESTVVRLLDKLIKKDLIIKQLSTSWNLYSINPFKVTEGPCQNERATPVKMIEVSPVKMTDNIYNNKYKDNNNNNIYTQKEKIEIANSIYKYYTERIDIESKYWYPSATKEYLIALLSIYKKEQLLTSIDNYFAVTEKKWRKSPKYFFSNSKRSDNYRVFEGFLEVQKPKEKKKEINILDII